MFLRTHPYLSLFLSASLLLTACKKNEPTATPASGITIEVGNLQSAYAPSKFVTFDDLDKSKVTLPAEGADRTWDYRNAKTAMPAPYTNTFGAVPANSGYPTATYILPYAPSLGAITFNSGNAFYEVSATGWFQLGATVTAQTLNLPNNVTLRAAGTAQAYTPKALIHKLPLKYEDTYSNTAVVNESYGLTAPALGLTTETPAVRKLTNTRNCKVTGWGKVFLPDNNNAIDVLQVKVTTTQTENYLLGGNPAPAQLLTSLGLTEGSVDTTTYYVYVSKTKGEIVEIGYANGAVTYGVYQK